MKKLLIGLMLLSSISAFAEAELKCGKVNDAKVCANLIEEDQESVVLMLSTENKSRVFAAPSKYLSFGNRAKAATMICKALGFDRSDVKGLKTEKIYYGGVYFITGSFSGLTGNSTSKISTFTEVKCFK